MPPLINSSLHIYKSINHKQTVAHYQICKNTGFDVGLTGNLCQAGRKMRSAGP